jgi:hypothetical protein
MARFPRLFAPLLGLALTASALPASASSPQAWNAYGQQVLKACVAASGLRNPRPVGERLDLPGRADDLVSALLLEGTAPQPHMAGRRVQELCVYDRTSRKARVADAERLHKPARQP